MLLADWAALYNSPKNSFGKKSKSLNTDNLLLETGKDDDDDDEFADLMWNLTLKNISVSLLCFLLVGEMKKLI